MRDLPYRVYAGIRTPRAHDFAAHARKLLDSVLERALHGLRARQTLPAHIRPAIIFNR
mgnify:CR=1 FL=1